ncbi:uncharacterized protein LOC122525255 [Polistes fuscatus]|uniref:uncharacterized protein LOC122525255 n=1 Tax=Polistes fuscatus TaxID=30207 RepID=UPI001CA8A9C6|nr:uncharacterized protein LOC122525255 [Polistes fuscatus]
MQRLWLEKVGWDDHLTPDIVHEWSQFRQHLSQLSVIETPRWINLSSKATSIQIHGFSDASQLAIAAVVYIKVSYADSSLVVSLVCAKTKEAPLKRLTIPRLELSAAALLAKLTGKVIRLIDLSDVLTFLWSDSSVTLARVKHNPMRWKEFLNPADCASEGLSASQLIDHPLWWSGPPWLSQSPEFWPSSMPPSPEEDLEERPGISLALSQAQPLRAVSCFKKVPGSSLSASPLNPADLEKAKTFWIRATKEAYFSPELRTLSACQSLHKRHILTRLTAFVDRAGILRVGGRLQNSQLDEDSKHPAILPRLLKFTNLVISDAHAKTMHGGSQLTLSYIRRTFWIIRGRAPVKSFLKDCLTCARIRGVRAQQLIAPLPASRVTPSLVFETTGLDYAGPVTMKTFQGKGAKSFKGWIAVFICFSTFAVHLEVVSDYTTEGFLKRLLANGGTNWIFNPPAAPHMGGKLDAAVKSIKYHLKRTISDTLLTFEDFSTFLAQVEAVLNSRPLTDSRALPAILEKVVDVMPASASDHIQMADIAERYLGRVSFLITYERLPPSKWPLARVIKLHPGKDGLCRVVTLKTATSTITRPIVKLAPLPLQPHTET